jgi:hypothetical protein
MLVLRTSRSAVRLAERLPGATRSLCAVAQVARRSGNAAAFQRLSLDFGGRHSCGSLGVRSFSSTQSDDDAQKAREEEMERLLQRGTALGGEKVYTAPMSRAVRLMKAVSVTSCTLTSIGMPVLCVLSEQDASMVGKVS